MRNECGENMVAKIVTYAFDGARALKVDVQVQITDTGINSYFAIVGLADKAVGESRERVRSAFASIGLALPPKRVVLIFPLPICQKKVRIMMRQLPWRFWRKWA